MAESDKVTHTCNPRTQESGANQLQISPSLGKKFQVILCYLEKEREREGDPILNNNNNNPKSNQNKTNNKKGSCDLVNCYSPQQRCVKDY